MSAKILFNGQDYDSVDAMPAEVRYAYEEVIIVLAEKDQNGIPDMFEKDRPDTLPLLAQSAPVAAEPQVTTKTRVKVNGQEVSNLVDIPADVRQSLRQINLGQSVMPSKPAGSWSPSAAPLVGAHHKVIEGSVPPGWASGKPGDTRFYIALGVIFILLLIIMGMLVYGCFQFAH